MSVKCHSCLYCPDDLVWQLVLFAIIFLSVFFEDRIDPSVGARVYFNVYEINAYVSTMWHYILLFPFEYSYLFPHTYSKIINHDDFSMSVKLWASSNIRCQIQFTVGVHNFLFLMNCFHFSPFVASPLVFRAAMNVRVSMAIYTDTHIFHFLWYHIMDLSFFYRYVSIRPVCVLYEWMVFN